MTTISTNLVSEFRTRSWISARQFFLSLYITCVVFIYHSVSTRKPPGNNEIFVSVRVCFRGKNILYDYTHTCLGVFVCDVRKKFRGTDNLENLTLKKKAIISFRRWFENPNLSFTLYVEYIHNGVRLYIVTSSLYRTHWWNSG